MSPEAREAARERALAAMAKRASTPDPTEAEIAAACRAIQETWCASEERSRRMRSRRWSLQQVRTVDFCIG
ncbi:hypothetical protein [Lacipirellula parvula]|uniref:Uncharacterized protein n=1 Tax=Lacipirellula parvula TaxID=2650471 RepID=A0A5K7X6E9_9BACT|nr:hypothetical protein [Lacipirellula parvula]BBO32108.1 hypothetical protein PLANPX_1720 [Lacipirellula parvula]